MEAEDANTGVDKASLNEHKAELERLQGENLNLKLRVHYLEDLLGEGKENAPSYWDIQSYVSREHGRMLEEAALEIKKRDEEIAQLRRLLDEAETEQRQLERQHAEQTSVLATQTQSAEELRNQVKVKDEEMLAFRAEMKAWTEKEVGLARQLGEEKVEALKREFADTMRAAEVENAAEKERLRGSVAEAEELLREEQRRSERELGRARADGEEREEEAKREGERMRRAVQEAAQEESQERERARAREREREREEREALEAELRRCQLEVEQGGREQAQGAAALLQREEEVEALRGRLRESEAAAWRLEEEAACSRREAQSNVETIGAMLKRAEGEIEAMRVRKGSEVQDAANAKEELESATRREADARRHAQELEEGWRRSQQDLTQCQDRLQEVLLKLADAEARAGEAAAAEEGAREQARELERRHRSAQAQVEHGAQALAAAEEVRGGLVRDVERERGLRAAREQEVEGLRRELEEAEEKMRRQRERAAEERRGMEEEVAALEARAEGAAKEGARARRDAEEEGAQREGEVARVEGRLRVVERELAGERERAAAAEAALRAEGEKVRRLQERVQRQSALSSQLQEQNEQYSAQMGGDSSRKRPGSASANAASGVRGEGAGAGAEEHAQLAKENFALRKEMEALQEQLAAAQHSAKVKALSGVQRRAVLGSRMMRRGPQEALQEREELAREARRAERGRGAGAGGSEERVREVGRDVEEARSERDEARQAARRLRALLEGVSRQTSQLQAQTEESETRQVQEGERRARERRELEAEAEAGRRALGAEVEAREEAERELQRCRVRARELEGESERLREKLADADKVAIASQRRVMELEGSLEKLSLSLPHQPAPPAASLAAADEDLHKLRACNRVLILELEDTRLRLLQERHRRHRAEAAPRHHTLPATLPDPDAHSTPLFPTSLADTSDAGLHSLSDGGPHSRQRPRPLPPAATLPPPPSPPPPPQLSLHPSPSPSLHAARPTMAHSPSPSPDAARDPRHDASAMRLSRTTVRHLSEPRHGPAPTPGTPTLRPPAIQSSPGSRAPPPAQPLPSPSPSPSPSPDRAADPDASTMALSERGIREVSAPPTSSNAEGPTLFPMSTEAPTHSFVDGGFMGGATELSSIRNIGGGPDNNGGGGYHPGHASSSYFPSPVLPGGMRSLQSRERELVASTMALSRSGVREASVPLEGEGGGRKTGGSTMTTSAGELRGSSGSGSSRSASASANLKAVGGAGLKGGGGLGKPRGALSTLGLNSGRVNSDAW